MAFTSRPLSRNDRGQNNYQRKYNISVHALERFRERVDEEFRYRDDIDLGNLLDEKLKHPESKHTVRDPRAPEEVTQLYEIVMRSGANYYVVMRNETAITVLDPDMAQRNFAESWKPTLNTPFNNDTLKKALHDVQVAGRVKLTPIDEAVLRGDVPPKMESVEVALPAHGSGIELTPLERAGLEHARALRRKHEAQLAVDVARRGLAEAERALLDADAACEKARLALFETVEST